jgi:hypothetical protein
MTVTLKGVDNFNLAIKKIKRIPKKIKREINRIPLVHARQETIYQAALAYYAKYLPKLNAEDTDILNSLQTQGVCITSLDRLQLPSNQPMLERGVELSQTLVNTSITNDFYGCAVELNKSKLIQHPQVFLWALETRLLDIVENYIGLPVIYQGCCLRKDLANNQSIGVRQWHLDWEDRRTIKIIIYLNDVDLDGGPFQYLTKDLTSLAVKNLNYHNFQFLRDEKMTAVIPDSQWQTCLSKAGTVIITDTANVFHRAKPAVKNSRYSITYCYTSYRPDVIWNNPGVSPEQWQNIYCQLNHRQRKCLIQS